MKSFGEYHPPETVGLNFNRLAIPHGHQLPRAPVQGELFFLDTEIDGKIDRPTILRGLYHSPGFGWQRFSEQFAKRKASPIGSQSFDVEQPADILKLPVFEEGFQIASAALQPEHRQISTSGMASFWVSLGADGYVVASVFRGKKLIAFVVEELEAEKSRTLSISFLDSPGSTDNQIYTLKINATVGALYINQSNNLSYDGASQTAFIIAENN